MDLNDHRKIEVDYDYINSVFDLYVRWKQTDDEDVYREMASKAIPMVNVFLSVAIRRHSLTGSEQVFDELYSFGYSTFLETIRKKKTFDEPNAFYVYMKMRVSYGIFSYYMAEHVTPDDIISQEDMTWDQAPVAYGVDINNISEQRFKSYMKYFLSCYSKKERQIFQYQIKFYQQEREEVTPALLEVRFNLPEMKAIQMVDRGRVIFRTILFFCLKEGEEPYRFINKKGEQIMISKYFLTLLAMEKKYPHLTELYALLGEKTHDVIQILGGERLKIPTIEELKDLDTEITAVFEFLENPTTTGLEEISQRNNIDRRKLNYILKSFRKRFSDVPFLGEELKAVDEVYG